MYRTGRGVPRDFVEAHKWYHLAATRSTGQMGSAYAGQLDSIAVLLTPAQLAEAQRLAKEWQAAFEARQAD